MSVKSFLDGWPLPSGFVLRRAVTVLAAASAALSGTSLSTAVSSAQPGSTPVPNTTATEFPGAPGTDPSLPSVPVPGDAGGPYGVDSPGQLTVSGIPPLAYQAYTAAAAALATTDPSCRLEWSLIAGIGRVESDHGRYNGSQLGPGGIVTPPILGVRLDGSTPGTARINDSDDGRYDGDSQVDRAVGPMQFLPATWKTYGAGADPQNINAAALATGRYLCAGDAPLTTQEAKWAAVYRYNHSDSYVSLVLSLAATYATGTPGIFPTRPPGTPPVTTAPPGTTPGRPPAVPVTPPSVPETPRTPTPKPTKSPKPQPEPTQTAVSQPGPTHARAPKKTIIWPTRSPAPTKKPVATGLPVKPTASPTITPSTPLITATSALPTSPIATTAIASAVPTTDAPRNTTPPASTTPLNPPASTTPGPWPTPSGTSPAATTSPAPPSTHRSGLGWESGFFLPGDNPSTVEAFGAWRRRPVDLITTWSARQTWADVTTPTWTYSRWAGTPYTTAFGVAPIPENDGATLAGCANGDYNYHWARFATTIAAAGLANRSIIRLGWEFNGRWYVWSATDPAVFAACWRQIHTTVEAIAPALRWDWSVNRGPSQALADPAAAYPGDAYVDYIGVDSYDIWPGATTEDTWQQQYAGPFGLKHWADFAAAHGKQLAVPEWGVYPGTGQAGHNGGDNPFYIAKMHEFFRSLGPRLGYESYFNEDAAYFAGSLQQNPAAAAQYLRELTP